MQEDFEECVGDFAVVNTGREAEELGHHAEVHSGAHEGADHGARRPGSNGSFALPARDVLAKELEDGEGSCPVLFEAFSMALQSGEEKGALEAGVAAVAFDGLADESAKEPDIVVGIHIDFPTGDDLVQFPRFVWIPEDSGVKCLFCWEMAEDDSFGDACGGGDFLGGGAFEALTGKEIEGSFEELLSAVFGWKSRGLGMDHPSIVSQYLLTCQ
jgi:hypothetical protein